jgi:hypothetical protein
MSEILIQEEPMEHQAIRKIANNEPLTKEEGYTDAVIINILKQFEKKQGEKNNGLLQESI